MTRSRQPNVVVVRRVGERAAFAIRDLSADGARLVGPLRLFEGELVEIQIELGAPFTLAAEGAGFDQQRSLAQVVFGDVSRDVLAQIERSIAMIMARARPQSPPTALIVRRRLNASSPLEQQNL